MKKEIHPDYQELELCIGSENFKTMSTSKAGKMVMDVDFRKHPAWTGKGVTSINDTNQNISAFNKRFAGLSLGAKSA